MNVVILAAGKGTRMRSGLTKVLPPIWGRPLLGWVLAAVRDAGAELRSIEDGLLDFPTVIDGVEAYWCWRTGEDDIAWWHPRATGFADRRPIPGIEG